MNRSIDKGDDSADYSKFLLRHFNHHHHHHYHHHHQLMQLYPRNDNHPEADELGLSAGTSSDRINHFERQQEKHCHEDHSTSSSDSATPASKPRPRPQHISDTSASRDKGATRLQRPEHRQVAYVAYIALSRISEKKTVPVPFFE